MRNYLINHCRSLIYSTALPAPIAATLTEAIRMLGEQNPENALGLELQRTSLSFRKKLRRVGFDLPLAPTPIVPILVGGDRPTLALAETLRKEGFLTVAIRPPTVPEGTSRLRLSLSHRHTEEQRNRLVETLARHWRR
jgi:7-keto-8-aminopelargonate synthetase-like enzyme